MKIKELSLTHRQLCDVEMLLCEGFAPLQTFLSQQDYHSVVENLRLADGRLWPMPINFDLSTEVAAGLEPGDRLVLKDAEGIPVASLDISEIWQPDKALESRQVFGSLDRKHPAVRYLFEQVGSHYVTGALQAMKPLRHYDSVALRYTPAALRAEIKRLGWERVVGFQTRNPMHRAHIELTLRAARDHRANLLIHPVVGVTKPGDVDHFSRVRCYEQVMQQLPEHSTKLALLPLAMRMAGPREALWHALIRKNYGCTHFIVGRDHAGPGVDSTGAPFYGPYAAQELVREFEDEMGIAMVPFKEMVYVEERAQYLPVDELSETDTAKSISGTEFRRRMREGLEIPDWFSFPEVVRELRRTFRSKATQGFTVFFTGLSGAGKSTLANGLMHRLMEHGGRSVSLLDGDVVRTHLSSELGFSKAHRDLNIQRIGFVASEITRAGGVALCAPIAPYASTRRQVRQMVEEHGGFIEVHVSTPLEVCEQRDPKGLYAKARAGEIKQFTGIDDPYEVPEAAEVTLDTATLDQQEAVQQILLLLESRGFVQ